MAEPKSIILTGASRGIGLAIAKFLLKDGHKVFLVAKTEEPLLKLKNEFKGQVEFLTADLSDFEVSALILIPFCCAWWNSYNLLSFSVNCVLKSRAAFLLPDHISASPLSFHFGAYCRLFDAQRMLLFSSSSLLASSCSHVIRCYSSPKIGRPKSGVPSSQGFLPNRCSDHQSRNPEPSNTD